MKTIIDSSNCSKYLFDDSKQVNVKSDCIEVGDTDSLEFIISDLNDNNATLIEGVTEPDDWYGCKYNYINDAWELCPNWVDTREPAPE